MFLLMCRATPPVLQPAGTLTCPNPLLPRLQHVNNCLDGTSGGGGSGAPRGGRSATLERSERRALVAADPTFADEDALRQAMQAANSTLLPGSRGVFASSLDSVPSLPPAPSPPAHPVSVSISRSVPPLDPTCCKYIFLCRLALSMIGTPHTPPPTHTRSSALARQRAPVSFLACGVRAGRWPGMHPLLHTDEDEPLGRSGLPLSHVGGRATSTRNGCAGMLYVKGACPTH
jgi:hypothetical protein